MGQDDLGLKGNQLRRVLSDASRIPGGPANIDSHIVADGPAKLPERLQERAIKGLEFCVIRTSRQDHPDTPQPTALLAMGSERPKSGRATEKA